ncbi:glutamyl-tRNA synthetase [Anseongella ginsenosidimutans]|uniref:Glutamyl-tRNA synthetase n=1 Tax=Anseongella ginsenosidimutans TaxID=496056 RepID=A0A4R3KXN1_9SPHI|nr:glutamate--tRNA ligase family protein [Anseongella ginsenosidimutans]TCS89220.1 glutamyl-tRNA synthetase [Anseongella ginsenosidimutans]
MKLKTRIAPTPTGFLHLGNVLSFALTAGLAAKTGAKTVLRIDDIDMERVKDEYVRDIFDTLNFLEIPWQEGPANFREYESQYSQFHRMELYREALQQLLEKKGIFACTCSRTDVLQKSGDRGYPGTCRAKKIPHTAENASWRLKTVSREALRVKTLQNGVVSTSLPASMRDFIVRRKDGLPSYQLASLADDLHYGINIIVRGADLWDSTLAQLSLAAVLERPAFGQAVFHHHELLKGPGGRKLSKTAGDISVQYLRKEGKKAADVYSLIGSMLQIKEPVKTWQSLAAALEENNTLPLALC